MRCITNNLMLWGKKDGRLIINFKKSERILKKTSFLHKYYGNIYLLCSHPSKKKSWFNLKLHVDLTSKKTLIHFPPESM